MEVELQDDCEMTRVSEQEVDVQAREQKGARGSRVLFAAALVIMLLLLSCAGALLWPVPQKAVPDTGGQAEGRAWASASLRVSDLTVTILDSASSSRLGKIARVEFVVDSPMRSVGFDRAFVEMQLDRVFLPPLERSDAPDGLDAVPARLERGRKERVVISFAIPRGSMDATLVVRAASTDDAHAVRIPLHLDTEVRR